MIRVLFLIHDLGHGGAEKVLVNLVNHLDRSKFDITVLALFGGGVNARFLRPDIHYKTVFPKAFPGNSHFMKLFSPRLLHRLFVKEQYDIEVSYLEGPSARIVSGCQHADTKLVSWIHCTMSSKKEIAASFRSEREAKACYDCFDRMVFVSGSVREAFLRYCPLSTITYVLYNTNETDLILSLKDESVEESVFSEGEIRLCGVGKLMPMKGFDRLARIHKRLRDEGYPVHSYVLGIGPEKEKLEAYLSEHHLENSFTLLGCNRHSGTFWIEWGKNGHHEQIIRMIRAYAGRDYLFGDSQITRPYIDWATDERARRTFPMLKRLWEGRDILLVEGEQTRMGVGNDLFDDATSVKRILAPAVDAFEHRNEIQETILANYHGELILMALGPTATILAADFAGMEIQALDIGNVDIEYEWFLRGAKERVAIPGKFTNEAKDGRGFSECRDEKYLRQIIARVGC